MSDIIIKVKNMQPVDYKQQGVPVVLKEGENLIPIEHWLVIKKIVERKIDAGYISIDRAEESRITELFKKECFTEFDKLGLSMVESSTVSGEFSKGVKQEFAREWLATKKESREQSRDRREVESIVIARKANTIAICAIVVSVITALFVAWLTLKFTK
ncbi:hypothetical protein [Vibrio sp. ArtGut-C1]|uniref:hypothetical protein n=1 Tax=Vibrio sp. ArtGut-C1 TaxID=2259137 RepID=UPI000A18D48E|nr:hypothetical protein [Vibrio sp. ArtGut-C1]